MNLGRRFLTILAVLIAASLVTTGCGDASDDDVVASIADQTLTQSQLDAVLEFGDATVPQLRADEVSTWLQRLAMSMEAERLGLEPTDADRDSADFTAGALIARQPNLDRDTLIEEILISIVLGRWADEEAATRDPLDPPDLLCSSHILFETEAEALVGLDRYINGEDFAELAMELSVGPSGPAGGSLDCQLTGTFVPEFEDIRTRVRPARSSGQSRHSSAGTSSRSRASVRPLLKSIPALTLRSLNRPRPSFLPRWSRASFSTSKKTHGPATPTR